MKKYEMEIYVVDPFERSNQKAYRLVHHAMI